MIVMQRLSQVLWFPHGHIDPTHQNQNLSVFGFWGLSSHHSSLVKVTKSSLWPYQNQPKTLFAHESHRQGAVFAGLALRSAKAGQMFRAQKKEDSGVWKLADPISCTQAIVRKLAINGGDGAH